MGEEGIQHNPTWAYGLTRRDIERNLLSFQLPPTGSMTACFSLTHAGSQGVLFEAWLC
jgi:hypothetical protein